MAQELEEKPKVEEVEEKKSQDELEKDAPSDPRPKISGACFLEEDTTMNVVVSDWGGILTAWGEAGLRYLSAGARANTGVKAGRYFYEVTIVEDTGAPVKGMAPKSFLRLGFSTAGSALLLGDTDAGMFFESDGGVVHGKKKLAASPGFGHLTTIGVLLNLDAKHANANTLSLFLDGVRATEPQELPEALRGKALFPHLSFKCLAVSVNFGPEPQTPLPFACHMIGDVAKADAQVTAAKSVADKSCEVVFPIGIPDEGAYDWVDGFLEKNPGYVELSERKVVNWAVRSGHTRPKSDLLPNMNSKDKPVAGFGVKDLDDGSALELLTRLAGMQHRNFVCMEVARNLMKEDRASALKGFSAPHFKKVARVIMGEPNEDYKKRVRDLILKDKQLVAQMDVQRKKTEKARQKTIQKRAREAEKARKKSMMIEKKRQAERKRKLEADQKAKVRAVKKAKGEAVSDEDEVMPKEGEEEKGESAEEEEPPSEPEEEEEAPKAELTLEESQLWWRKSQVPDVTHSALCSHVSSFRFPEKEEGFDEIWCAWSQEDQAKERLKRWVLDRKRLMPVEDITPSEWFKEKRDAWLKDFALWQGKLKAARLKRSDALLAASNEKKEKDKAAAPTPLVPKEKVSIVKPPAGGIKKAVTPIAAAVAAAAANLGSLSEETGGVDPVEALKEETEKLCFDVFGVDDICDLGDGVPLFIDWEVEDWTLLSLRFEVHLLLHSFKRDCKDEDRACIRPEHLAFYYQKYFRKGLLPKNYGTDHIDNLLKLIDDTICIHPFTQAMDSVVCEDHDGNAIFVKLVEESRRVRLKDTETKPPAEKEKEEKNISETGKVGPKLMPLKSAAAASSPGDFNNWLGNWTPGKGAPVVPRPAGFTPFNAFGW